MSKEENLEFIKKFAKINISELCRELSIDRSNVLKGRASEETTKKLADRIKEKLKELLKNN